ncbi:MAG: TraB/GumN family protein [Saprospiraceae bacterium]|nr:TraB/GumN family protein [Saprospiraceae bacterium]
MKKNSLLWEIRKGKLISYVFGSIHLSTDKFDTLQKSISKYIESCQVCAIEINLEHAGRYDVNLLHSIKEDESYLHYLSEKKWKHLVETIQEHIDLNMDELKSLHPFIILNLVLQKLLSDSKGSILDEWIWNQAKENNKILEGLEDLQEHYNTLHKIPIKLQYKLLYESLSDFSSFKRKMSKLLSAYLQQDIRKLFQQAKKYTGSARKVLLYERNISIADRIETLTSLNSVFAVAGAGHLYGKFGLLKLLKSKGFVIRPIKIET